MYVKEMEIFNFKAFEGESSFKLKLSKNINCIAGHNGVGKSTILAILSNCGELKKKDGEQINGNAFRGEYSQIVKGDINHDTPGKKCILSFQDLPKQHDKSNPFIEKLEFRATFQTGTIQQSRYKMVEKNLYQKEKIEKEYKRYRLLPIKDKEKRNTEKKLNWPVIYLGLTRLFPIGESEETDQATIPSDILDQLHNDHKKILSSYDEYLESVQIGISDTQKKLGFGISTKDYSAISNSSGQDNLGQILLAIYSFERLKKNYSNYSGGILLIDEIDATLHPASQNNLIDFLLEKSIELDLQIVFTTHSLSLIQHLNFKRRNSNNKNSIQVNYLDKSTNKIIIKNNPENEYIRNNLFNTYTKKSNIPKITIYTEDDVGKWFLESILKFKKFEETNLLKFNTASKGWTTIIDFIKNDYHIFKDTLVFLDPDLSLESNRNDLYNKLSNTMYRKKINTKNGRIFYLELDDYIENIFWKYLSSLPPDHHFYLNPIIMESQFNSRSVKDNGPDSCIYSDFTDNKIKVWFNDNRDYVDILFEFWFMDNKEVIDKFYENFCSAFYNIVTQKTNIF